MISSLGTMALVVACSGLVIADVESGPKAGTKVPGLKATIVLGEPEGKEVDLAELRKDKPTVYLLVRSDAFGRPAFRFMKTLDEKLGETTADAAAVIVWMGESADKDTEFLTRASKSLSFVSSTVAVSKSGKAGPDNWAVNPDAHLTVVVAKNNKVVKVFGFDTVNETDVRKVLMQLKSSDKK